MFRNGKRNGRGKYQLTDGRVEIYRYVNDARVGDGVRWSANRKKAWRMNEGKVTKRVSIDRRRLLPSDVGHWSKNHECNKCTGKALSEGHVKRERERE